ncbi:MAG: hypothetical protein HXS46_11190 [Theionarchaea archaeon]|nr:MAG: hypothetical protein AYK18_02015 [Theionarchaea archaeon DG-70]MBU7011246.1 hypothetical protein [Theionarchaea archaeon]
MVLEELEKKEREREKRLKERFNADSKDIIAFSVAAWQLFIPLIAALLVVGLIVMLIFKFV